MDDSQIELFKVVILGETGVGKTSIISQFIDQTFQEDIQSSTGSTFSSKSFIIDKSKILKFEIWDTAGQERYRALTKMFYKDANAAILVYDITRKISFEELQNYWVEQIKESAPSDIILVIVANKSDLTNKEEVDEEEARNLATKIGAFFCSTSAKKSHGIDDLFLQIAKKHTGSDDIKIKNNDDEDFESQEASQISKNGSMKLTKEKTFIKNEKKKKCC